VISKRRCPHTGIVNFFANADPLVAIGSISESPATTDFAWRCYLDEEISGLARNMTTAEASLRRAIGDRRFQEVRLRAA
jgi:hypothetical protein